MESKQWIPLNLPNYKHIGKFLLWSSGRILISVWLFTLHSTVVLCKGIITLTELSKQSTLTLLKVYDQLPYMGTTVSSIAEVPVITASEPPEIITDVVTAIESRQLMIIGNSGSGKSTVAQYLAYTVGGKVRVLECEGTPDDWIGLEVVGRGEDWEAIDKTFQFELEEITRRVKLREQHGDKSLAGLDEITIVEEYPEVRQKCQSADEWFDRHARRGRKMKRWIICLSQYDRVAAWGLEGKSDLGDCFYRLRLGKVAVNHAKALKNDNLVAWLRADKSHCLLDDYPCKLPSYREMKAVTQRLVVPSAAQPIQIAETTTQQELQPLVTPRNAPEETIKRAVKACLEDGWSDSRIIKQILGYTGSQYNQGKDILDGLKKQ